MTICNNDDDMISPIIATSLLTHFFGLSLLSLSLTQDVIYRTEITEVTEYPLRLGFISGINGSELKYGCLRSILSENSSKREVWLPESRSALVSTAPWGVRTDHETGTICSSTVFA